MPGDIIIADDDGAVVVPVQLAPQLAEKATEHVEWEEFSRLKLAEGGDLRKYYPLSDEARPSTRPGARHKADRAIRRPLSENADSRSYAGSIAKSPGSGCGSHSAPSGVRFARQRS